MLLNKTPIRTSSNYGINNINIENLEIPKEIQDFNTLNITGNTDKFSILNEPNKTPLVYGVGKELEKLCFEKANKKIKILAKESGKLNLDFSLNDENNNLIENIEINSKISTNNTVYIKYFSNENLECFHNGIIRVNAEKNSKINVVILNMSSNKTNNFLSLENYLEENSIVNYCIVDFGGKLSITNWYSNIKGNEAEANINTIYLGTENQIFDLNYISELYGEKTKSNIEVQGALKENSKKNFKGTLDFKRGSKKSKGNENEFCMLLSENAKSKALPILLCTEEDIEGNHSTATGKVDNLQLFYIMSRGLSYNDAIKLIVKAKFNKVIETIEDEKVKNEVLNELERRLD